MKPIFNEEHTHICILILNLKYRKLFLQVKFIIKQDSENPIFTYKFSPYSPCNALSSQRVLLDFCLAGGLLISLRRRVEHITEWWLLHGRSTRNQYEIILQLWLAVVKPATTHNCQRRLENEVRIFPAGILCGSET